MDGENSAKQVHQTDMRHLNSVNLTIYIANFWRSTLQQWNHARSK